MLKEERSTMVGLSGFKKTTRTIISKPKKKVNKEVKLSDLMRRSRAC